MGPADTEQDTTTVARRPLRLGVGSLPVIETGQWTTGETFSSAEPAEALRVFVAGHLKAQGLAEDGDMVVVRHRAGDRGLPVKTGPSEYRFTLDLTDSRRALDGGFLLFVESAGRVTGWRPERGALTIWSGADPELTELAPGALERLTLFGRAKQA